MWAEAITAIFNFFTVFLKRRTTGESIKQIIGIFDEMKFVISETDAERILVFKIENGGGIIKPGVQLYYSVIYEDFEKAKFDSTKDRFQRIHLDSEALTMLSQAIDKKSIAVDASMLPQNSMMFGIWEQQGITYSEYYHLQSTKKCVFFCSVSTTSVTRLFASPMQHSIVSLSVEKIRQLLNGKRVKESL